MYSTTFGLQPTLESMKQDSPGNKVHIASQVVNTPQKILESFLHARALVYADANVHLAPVYEKFFGEPLIHRVSRFMLQGRVEERIEDVNQSADSARITTSRRFKLADNRTRYHLKLFGETWKIVRIDRECFFCRGTGQSGTFPCEKCGGEGWQETGSSAA